MMEILIRQSLGASEKKDPFSVDSGALFIGVGGLDFAQTPGDLVWHVKGPTRPFPESLESICDRYEVISYRSRLPPIELKFGGDVPRYVCNLQLKFHGIWISGLRDIVDTR